MNQKKQTKPHTEMGRGALAARHLFRWKNGNQISEEFWAEMIAEIEQDAYQVGLRDGLDTIYKEEGETNA